LNYRKDGTPAAQDSVNQSHAYTYDANGNLIYINTSTATQSGNAATKTDERKLLWDEENRLRGIDDIQQIIFLKNHFSKPTFYLRI
jgi:YD repeat-containing protein